MSVSLCRMLFVEIRASRPFPKSVGPRRAPFCSGVRARDLGRGSGAGARAQVWGPEPGTLTRHLSCIYIKRQFQFFLTRAYRGF